MSPTRCLFLALVLVLPACGALEEKFGRIDSTTTTVHLQRNDGLIPFTLDGNLMVYLVRSDGNFTRSLHLQNEFESRSVNVPNGNYRIYAVGWDGPNNLEGTTRCASANGANPISLSGGSVTVNLGLTVAGCNYGTTNVFADATHSSAGNMRMQDLRFCTNSSPANGSCSGAASYTGGTQMVLYEYTRSNSQFTLNRPGSLVSNCYNASAGTVAAPGPRIPSGTMLVAGIEAFSLAGCTGSLRTYQFFKGFRSPGESPGATYAAIDPITDFDIYLYKDF